MTDPLHTGMTASFLLDIASADEFYQAVVKPIFTKDVLIAIIHSGVRLENLPISRDQFRRALEDAGLHVIVYDGVPYLTCSSKCGYTIKNISNIFKLIKYAKKY